MKRSVKVVSVFVLLLMLVACANLQQKWTNATDDERARIVIQQTQASLKTSFVTSKAFVDANPRYSVEWKTKIVPMFDAANKVLGDLIKQGQAGQKLTYMQVLSAIGGRLGEIATAVSAWGLKLVELETIVREV